MALLILLVPGRARAELSIQGSIAAGQESTVAYEIGLRNTFEPWLDGAVTVRPLVEVGGFAWDGSGDTVWGGSASAGLTLDIVSDAVVRPFITGTLGAALLSDNRIGDRKLGKHGQIKSRGAAGLRFGEDFRHSIHFEVTHYSNAGTHCENSGFTTYGGGYACTF